MSAGILSRGLWLLALRQGGVERVLRAVEDSGEMKDGKGLDDVPHQSCSAHLCLGKVALEIRQWLGRGKMGQIQWTRPAD